MEFPLAPIQALSGQHTALADEFVKIDAESRRNFRATLGDVKIPFGLPQVSIVEERGREHHTEPACQMVITQPRLAKFCLLAVPRSLRRWAVRRQVGERLKLFGHLQAGEPEIAKPPVRLDAEQVSLDQLGEMTAGRLAGDARDGRKLGRRPGPSVPNRWWNEART